MDSARSRYRGHRFPPEIIGYAVWVEHRFCLSFRDVEDLLVERGITVSHEAIRRWCWKFGPDYSRRLKKKQGRLGDTWYLDELFVRINASSSIFGVPWIRMVMSSIFCCSLAAISVQPSGCQQSGPESILHCATFTEIDSSPTLKISVLRGLAKRNGGPDDFEFPVSNQPKLVPNSLSRQHRRMRNRISLLGYFRT
jgi:hypothetical protein